MIEFPPMVEALLNDLERTIIDCLLNTFKDADALLRYDILFSALVKPSDTAKSLLSCTLTMLAIMCSYPSYQHTCSIPKVWPAENWVVGKV